MAINKKLITFSRKDIFLGANGINGATSANSSGFWGNIPSYSIVFIKDTCEIWHNGKYFSGIEPYVTAYNNATRGFLFRDSNGNYTYKSVNLWGNTFDGSGDVNGKITRNSGGSWISGRDNVVVELSRTSSEGSDWHPIIGVKTTSGYWSMGSVGGESLCLSYDTDTDYNNSNNSAAVINFPTAGRSGTLALTSDITWANVLNKPTLFDWVNTNYNSNGSYDANAATTFSYWSAKETANVPNFYYGGLLTFPYNIGTTAWSKQIYITNADSPSGYGIYARWNYDGTWQDWVRVALVTDNVASATNADTVDGLHADRFIRYYDDYATNPDIDALSNTPYLLTVGSSGSYGSGTKPSGSHNGFGVLNVHTHVGDFYTQLGLDTNQNLLWIRSANNSSSYGNWTKILNEANTYVSNNKGYINDTEITYVNNAGYVTGTDDGNWDADVPGTSQYLWFYGQSGGVSHIPGSYGSVVTFFSGGTSSSLHAQLYWNINHDSSNASNGIWWRAKNNLGWDATWHRLYDNNYHPSADTSEYPAGFSGRQSSNWTSTGLSKITGWHDGNGGDILFLTNGSGLISVEVDGFFYQGIDTRGEHRVLDEYDAAYGTWVNATYAANMGNASDYVTFAQVKALHNWYTTAAGSDTQGVIDNWNEIKNFIDGFHETDDLATYLVNTFVAKTGSTMQISSGTILSALYAADIFGYNPSYGTYIGGNFSGSGSWYIYSGSPTHPNGPCAWVNGTLYDLIHTGNYSSYLGYIGTTGVLASSAIQSLQGISSLNLQSSGNEQYINFLQDSTVKNQIDSGPTLFEIFSYYNGWRSDLAIARATGNVGIGTSNPSYKLDVEGTTYISDYLKVGGHITRGNEHIISPSGGSYSSNGSSETGYIIVRMPHSLIYCMMSLWIDIYSYSTNESCSIHCGAYTYNDSFGHAPFSTCIGKEYKTRFCYDSDYYYIVVGESDTVWYYPKFMVRDMLVGYSKPVSEWLDKSLYCYISSSLPGTEYTSIQRYVLHSDNYTGLGDARYLRKDANDSTGYQYSFTKTNDHAIQVGTIRGRAVGDRTGEYIHLYERVHIGSPNGWGSNDAPTYGLSTYGGAWLATDTGNVAIGYGATVNNKLYINGDVGIATDSKLNGGYLHIAENTFAIDFRPGHASYGTGFFYGTYGNEFISLLTEQSVTSIIFGNGYNPQSAVSGSFVSGDGINYTYGDSTDVVQIKQNCVNIGGVWFHNVTPDYKLKVNGNTYITYAAGDSDPSLTVVSTSNGSWRYTASFLAPNLSNGNNNAIFIGKAHSTRNSFGLTHYHVGDGSTDNYSAVEIWGVGNVQRWYYDGHTLFLGSVAFLGNVYPYSSLSYELGTSSSLWSRVYSGTYFLGGNDGTLLAYTVDGGNNYGSETVAIQTCFDNITNPESHQYVNDYWTRCFLALQPRNGVVGINETTYNRTRYNDEVVKLIVNGAAQFGKNDSDNTAFRSIITLFANLNNESYNENFNESASSWGISFKRQWNSTDADLNISSAGIYAVGSGNWRTGLAFRVKNNQNTRASHDITALWLSPAGNVGIGALTPRAKLDVGGEDSAIIVGNTNGTPGISSAKKLRLGLGTVGHSGSDYWAFWVDDTTSNSYLKIGYTFDNNNYLSIRHDGLIQSTNDIYANSFWRTNTNYGLASDGNFYAYAVYANREGYSTAGGVSLYGTSNPINEYGIAFRGTGSYGVHGRVLGDWATYLTMDSSSNRGWIFRSGGTNYASISARGEAYFDSVGRNNWIAYPSGGYYTTTASTVTGAIRIKLPSTFSQYSMLKFTVEIYDYNGGDQINNGTSASYTIGGHNWNNGYWYGIIAYSNRGGVSAKGNLTVRFGNDGTNHIVWIGETDTVWSYPQVVVKDVLVGYSNIDYNIYGANWAISFATSFDTVTNTITNPAINYKAEILSDWYRVSRVSKNESNDEIETVTGWKTDNFIQIQRFCPPSMYRTTEDLPAPYGIGFGNGSESGGIMPVGSGDYLQEIRFYGANSGPTIFTFGRQVWESTGYDNRYSNRYETYTSIDGSNGYINTSGRYTLNGYAGTYHTANNIAGYAGEIWFGGNFHIDSQNGYSLYLNYHTSESISLAQGGGNVGIGQLGGTHKLNVVGNIDSYNFKMYGSSLGGSNCNDVTNTGLYYYTSNGPSGLGEQSTDGALYSQAYSTDWVALIAQDYRDGRLYIRSKNNGTWKKWYTVALSGEEFDLRNNVTFNPITLLFYFDGGGYITSKKYYRNCIVKFKAPTDTPFIRILLTNTPGTTDPIGGFKFVKNSTTAYAQTINTDSVPFTYATTDYFSLEAINGTLYFYLNSTLIHSCTYTQDNFKVYIYGNGSDAFTLPEVLVYPLLITTPSLNNLSNVSISNPVSGLVLKYNGTNWANATIGGNSFESFFYNSLNNNQTPTYYNNGVILFNSSHKMVSIGTFYSEGILRFRLVSVFKVDIGFVDVNVGNYNGVISVWSNRITRYDGTHLCGRSIGDLIELEINSLGQVIVTYDGHRVISPSVGTMNLSLGYKIFFLTSVQLPDSVMSLFNFINLSFDKSYYRTNPYLLSDLADVNTDIDYYNIGSVSGQYLKFQNNRWINSSIALEDLSNVTISSPTTGLVLQYNGSAWVNASAFQATSWADTDGDGKPGLSVPTISLNTKISAQGDAKNIPDYMYFPGQSGYVALPVVMDESGKLFVAVPIKVGEMASEDKWNAVTLKV